MYPTPRELLTESDVEQKLISLLLTSAPPEGLGYSSADVFTKLSTRRIEIGKGAKRKLYFPDYMVVLAGLPVMIIEAKGPGESVETALEEARLYANEINSLYPHKINPCIRVVACNGTLLVSAPVDTAAPDVTLTTADFGATHPDFAKFVAIACRAAFQAHVNDLRNRIRPKSFKRPVSLVGGSSFQNEELPQNTFGATIVGDYGHIFNPKSREDRAKIVREAYIPSMRHQRYVEPIDRLVRNAVAPTAAKVTPLENSAAPIEITAALQQRKRLENQILLLIGSVGAGKSTFVDYLSLVALPDEIRAKTVWLRVDLNLAPLEPTLAYHWLAQGLVEQLRASAPDIDFDRYEVLEKIFHQELNSLKKGPLAVLDPNLSEYRLRIADRLNTLQSNALSMAKGIASYLCAGPGSLLIIALDNCDKRTRDEQLMMFQVAQWVQSEFRCLVILPLRDVTFDLHRNDPPLDTALKQFVFRIEPPPFSDVLQARVRLTLSEIAKTSQTASALSYQLPNGIKVTYPAEDQALYLASILRSLYAHDRFVRQVMTGLAGRDVRKAMEIFLDFCMSGHIGEDEIFKIRFLEGHHVLPISVVARVLLRMSRRFYDGNRSHLKNIVQCDPDDALPDHFVRLAILHWFEKRLKLKGPAGVEGFHRVTDMLSDLAAVGHDGTRVREELKYLAREGCVLPEHLRADALTDGDLVKVSAAGVVHLQLLANPEYLAACAEDTWIADPEVCKSVAQRIGAGFATHFSRTTTARNATELVDYLKGRWKQAISAPEVFLEPAAIKELEVLREAEAGVAAAEISLPERLFVGGLDTKTTQADIRNLFSSRGIEIKEITLPMNNGVGRGFAFVQPATRQGILTALELDGVLRQKGRRLRISEAHPLEEGHFKSGGRERAIPALTTRVYLANLPYASDATDVRALLAEQELTATDIFLLRDKRTKQFRGAAFLEFGTLDDAANAIGAFDGLEFKGRKLSARPADPRVAS